MDSLTEIATEARDDFYLYFIYRHINGEEVPHVCYVGRGCGDRVNAHLNELKNKGTHKHNRLLKEWYNTGDSEFESKIVFPGLTNEEANALEVSYIACYGRHDLGFGRLANLTDGGEGIAGMVFTSEHRAKIGAGNKGKMRTEAQRQANRMAKLGTKLTLETREKISAANIGRKWSDEQRANLSEISKGKPGTNKGKTFSKEHRDKISKARKGKPSPFKGKKQPREAVEKMLATRAANKVLKLAQATA